MILRHAPYHWQLAISANAGHLLRIERQVVPSTPAVFSRPICPLPKYRPAALRYRRVMSVLLPAKNDFPVFLLRR